jgi:hypothetical protein
MRFRYRALKRLIEAAISPSEASSQGLALVIKEMGDGDVYVVYNTEHLTYWCLEGIKEGDDPNDSIQKNSTGAIVGVIATERNKSKYGPCNDGVVVTNAAAKKGYGPMVYDVVLSMGDPVSPDRSSVSKDALSVWDTYLKSRSDVEKIPLDDITNPRTPDPLDDCKFYTANEDPKGLKDPKYTPKDPRNFSYEKKGGVGSEYSGLFDNDENSFKEFNSRLKKMGHTGLSKKSWKDQICYAASDYFNIRYATDVIHPSRPR